MDNGAPYMDHASLKIWHPIPSLRLNHNDHIDVRNGERPAQGLCGVVERRRGHTRLYIDRRKGERQLPQKSHLDRMCPRPGRQREGVRGQCKDHPVD